MTSRPMPPNGGLKQPVKRFEDTFSAQTVIMEMFFPANKPGRCDTAVNPSEDGPVA